MHEFKQKFRRNAGLMHVGIFLKNKTLDEQFSLKRHELNFS